MHSATILIVEDDPIISSLIEIRLKKLGFSVCGKAKNEAETMECVQSQFPDVILMDIALEDGNDGVELARKILGIRDVPVIYLTANGDNETLMRAAESHPQGFIMKPFRDDDLRISIELALCNHPRRPD
ncbi:MAG TPA: response regulator [Methanoregulaceae archaeon]|nr:response regulator [Methanoregulaceae archaeon]